MASHPAVHQRRPAGDLQRGRPGLGDVAHSDRSQERDQGRSGYLRAGQVDDQPRHHQRGRALRLLRRRDSARDAAGRHVQSVRHVCGLSRRRQQPQPGLYRHGAEMEGHQPAPRHRVRRVRQRQDRGEGERRPLRRRPADCHRRCEQRGKYRGRDRYPRVDGSRQERVAVQLGGGHSAQRAHRLDVDAELRQERCVIDAHRSGRPERLGRAWLQLGVHRQRAAPARAARVAERRLVSAQVRQPDSHGRQPLQFR